jgi:hypothetical protein
MKLTTKLILLLGFAVLLVSCRSNPVNFEGGTPLFSEMKNLSNGEDVPPPPPLAPGEASADKIVTPYEMEPEAAVIPVSRKIIKDGRMEIRVKELAEGRKQVDTLVKKFRGYYAEETFNNMDFSHGYSLKIRIPSDRFESFVGDLESGLGELAYKNITSRDVTEEFIDLETRLKNKRNYLNRYADLLKRAGSVKDILDIQEKTRLIEEEVESVQGRLKYLNNQVDYSTLDLQLSKKNDFNEFSRNKGSFADRLRMSVVKGWFGLVTFTLFIIRIWPFWIIVGILYYLIRIILKRRHRK